MRITWATVRAYFGWPERTLYGGVIRFPTRPIEPDLLLEEIATAFSEILMSRVLVVDDRPMNRQLLTELLDHNGFETCAAGDGREALDLVESFQPDLAIVDVLMPTMDGREFVELLNARPGRPRIPIIFYTATFRLREATAMALAAGVKIVLPKPSEPRVILATVKRIIEELTSPIASSVETPIATPQENPEPSEARFEAERTSLRLAAIIEFSQDIAQERDLANAVRRFCSAARDVVSAQFAVVRTIDQTSRWTIESCGLDPARAGAYATRTDLVEVIRQFTSLGKPVRLTTRDDSDAARMLAPLFPDVHSYLGVPIASASVVFGWCALFNKIGSDEFSAEDEEIALTLASQMAVTLENMLLYDAALEHTHELERQIAGTRRVEVALSAAGQRYHDIIHFAPMGIYQATRSGRLVMANAALARILGFESADELMTTQVRDLYFDYEEHLRSLARIPPGQSAVVERRMRRKDGREVCVEKLAHSVRDENGHILYDEAFLRDVTERKAAEERARQVQRSLDKSHRVNSLGRVAATVAHEFNNVLMGIGPFAELIRRRAGGDEKISQAAEQISGSVHRGKRITEEILRFTNAVAPALRIIDICAWLAQLEPELRAIAGSGLRMTIAIPDESVYVRCDSVQMQQVVANLAINACDATPCGGAITLALTTGIAGPGIASPLPDGEAFVCLTMRDDGGGVAPEILEQIFEPLFTTKRSGTGLGLAVARQVVIQHGGFIFAENEPEGGAAFHIFLPRVDVALIGDGPGAVETLGANLFTRDQTLLDIGIRELVPQAPGDASGKHAPV